MACARSSSSAAVYGLPSGEGDGAEEPSGAESDAAVGDAGLAEDASMTDASTPDAAANQE